MGMKLTINAVCRGSRKGLGLALLAVGASLSGQVHAESVLCDATQASTDQLPQLEASCPIGKGIWGSKAPKTHSESNLFWVQCGLLNDPLPLEKAKPIYKNISTNVWMKPEQGNYRCLIGPYSNYADARKELLQVRKVSGYKEAFIRMVDKSQSTNVAPLAAATAKADKAAAPKARVEAQPIERTAAKAPATAAVAKASAPAPKAPAPKAVSKPASEPMAIQSLPDNSKSSSDAEVEVRLTASVSGKTYSVPYILDGKQQFYMEQGKPWSRLDYGQAQKTCNGLGMELLSEDDWQTILDSKVMEQKDWPMHLPYWGAQKKGLFTNGNVTQLKGSSLLNVMCVK